MGPGCLPAFLGGPSHRASRNRSRAHLGARRGGLLPLLHPGRRHLVRGPAPGSTDPRSSAGGATELPFANGNAACPADATSNHLSADDTTTGFDPSARASGTDCCADSETDAKASAKANAGTDSRRDGRLLAANERRLRGRWRGWCPTRVAKDRRLHRECVLAGPLRQPGPHSEVRDDLDQMGRPDGPGGRRRILPGQRLRPLHRR